MSVRSKLSPVLLLGAALTLGACASKAPSAGGPPQGGPQNPTASAGSPASAPVTSTAPTTAAATAATQPAKSPAKTSSSGGDADSDSYAWSHPCAIEQLTVTVTPAKGDPTQRVIAVRNNGAAACGLSYYPRVYLDDSRHPGGQIVKPMIPGGLGGPPASPVHAHQTVYAVTGLNPESAAKGTASGIDEINVLADGDHMPNVATLNFPLGAGALVARPKLGLYERSVDDAVASMLGANTQL
jgi:hypothetical protein